MNVTEANATTQLLRWLTGQHDNRDLALAAAETLAERAGGALQCAPLAVQAAWPLTVHRADQPLVEVETEWCVWHGGTDPENCAGRRVTDDQAAAEEDAQWLIESGVAWRNVYRTGWTVQPEADRG